MYELSPLARHLTDTDIVIAAGATMPASWTALRDRHAQPLDSSMSRRYVEAVLTGAGDLLALRTAAIAEVVAMNNMPAQAAIANVLDSAVAAELQAIYAPVGPGVYDYCADRFAATAGRFHKACSVVDLECDPATLITSSSAQRTQWSDGGVLAHELDLGLNAMAAAARLAGVETPLETFDQMVSLAVDDVTGPARRALWTAWDSRGRTGRWAAVAAIATIRPTPLESIVAIARPPALATRQVRRGIGWATETYDPLFESVSA